MRLVVSSIIPLLAISCCAFGQTYTIRTIAGNGTAGYSGDNGPATSAELSGPGGIALDAAGNLYIVDNNRIREVSNGVIATVAGNGTAGFSGDNGPATVAELKEPSGVAVDAAGNLYIADWGNGRIRKVSNGVITTVAGGGPDNGIIGDGGPAVGAFLSLPSGVALDAAGNLYIADSGNHRVRKVSKGVITTIAGIGCEYVSTCIGSGDNGPATSAVLNGPGAVAVDTVGNVYITDRLIEDSELLFGDCIRMVSNGVITTVAGGGVYRGDIGDIGDNGPAVGAFVSLPSGVAADAAGNLYIADHGNNRIRKVSNGLIATVAGNGTVGYTGDGGPATSAALGLPGGVAVDSAGNVYIADSGNNRIRVLTPSAAPCSGSVVPATLTVPASADDYTFSIRAASSCAWAVQGLPAWITIAGSASGIGPGSVTLGVTANSGGPRGALVSIAGASLSVTQQAAAQPIITSVSPISALQSQSIVITGSGFGSQSPYTGNSVYISFSDAPKKWSAGYAGPCPSGSFEPGSVFSGCVGPISDAIGLVVQSWSDSSIVLGGFSGAWGGNSTLNVGDAVQIYVWDPQSGTGPGSILTSVGNGAGQTYTIRTFAGNGTPYYGGDNGPATSAELNGPSGVAVDAAGNVYIVDTGNNRVRKVSNGVITTVAGTGAQGYSGDNGPATSAQLAYPSGVAVDSGDNVYVADTGNNRIRKISNGVITTVAGTGASGYIGDNGPATSAALQEAIGIAVDAARNLYIADAGNYRIREVSNGIITTVAGNGTEGYSGDNGPATSAEFYDPLNVAVDAPGNLYIADQSIDIRKVSNGVITTVAGNGTQGYSGDNGPATSASMDYPEGVALDAAGNLYIADVGNYRIRKVSNGVITTVAGNGTQGYSGDNGPATSAQLGYLSGVAVDAAGDIYVIDGNRIRVLTPSAAACSVSVTPTALTVPASGGNYTVGIQVGSSCPWTVPGLPTWITLVGSVSGTGPGIATLAVSANSGGQRVVVVSVAGAPVTVTQMGTSAGPSIAAGGIVPVDSAVATIEPGEWVSIYGTNLASSTAAWNGNFPTSLGGTSVTINGKLAYLSYVSPTQINLQAPSDSAMGPVPVIVTTAGGTSTGTVTLAQFGPAFLLLDSKHVAGIIARSNGSGAYGGGTYDILGPTGTSLGYPTVAAKAGDIVELFGTGFGPTNPAVPAGQAFTGAAATANAVNLLINNASVTPIWAGLSGAGLDQINLTVPAGFGKGDVSLVATVGGGVQTPTGVVISLQ